MGIFDRLQGKSRGRIQVTVDPAVAPGEEVRIRFDVLADLDDKARGIRAGVTCTGHYRVIERERSTFDDDRIESNEVTRSVELFEVEETLPAQRGPQEVTVRLPERAAPSSDQVVTWEAWVRVDREHGVDVVERVPFDVRVPLEQIPETRAADTTDDGLTMTGAPTAVATGDTISGQLSIQLAESVKARTVAVRLHRRLTYVADAINDYDVFGGDLVSHLIFSNTSRITEDHQVAEVELAGAGTYDAGSFTRLDFAIVVPDAGPTTSHPYAQVDWRLEAVLDRRLLGDKSVETPLIVV